ncbi:MAG TPA: hypothetical protein PKO06_14215 [Candidatus Ozemobacteraceae bacterium]|nr:hypothetical protein [Candidatus Ozemobacteraceae bacterium]
MSVNRVDPGVPRWRHAFTVIEMIVVALVLSVFVITLMYLYQWITYSYRSTSWKQERTRETEEFWNLLRKNLEEASNIHEEDSVTLDLSIASCPLHFRTLPSIPADGSLDGDLMAWVRARMNPATRTSEYKLACRLWVQKRQVFLSIKSLSMGPVPTSETIPARAFLNDVSGFIVQATPIRQDPSLGDYADTGGTGVGLIIGTQIEVSILFEPAANTGLGTLRLAQNHKFRVPVEHVVESSGNSSFAY